MFIQFLQLIRDLILPIFLVVLVGYFARQRMGLQVAPIVTLNLYFFVPAYLFTRISQSEIGWGEVGQIGLGIILPMLILGPLLLGFFSLFKVHRETAAVITSSSLFFNSGNFGIPLAELAFGAKGGQVQAFVVMFTSLATFFFGYWIIIRGQRGGWSGVAGRFFRMPYIYVVLAALSLRGLDLSCPAWSLKGLEMLSAGMVPTALITLGAQLGGRSGSPRWAIILPVCVLKLLVLPAIALGVSSSFGTWPWPGTALLLATAAPTAVNTLLITLDVGGDAELAADCIFWCTLLSAFTVAGWLACCST
jgi:malate permease and related proteins